ncbi:3-deoxy-manno-octulosonate cytidylyltransferase [Alphaproteobacteria bacterium GH1-50]|uniref:3-deoxy-manno-octulosonate cytidylyltransferase n=1 Tax=Kangsaoukella pontilimi TaxID=2691042 RepID=A0A7C9MTV1_9RHOB|nr:manno-octulosonate cytidylyltransferase [Kangsaoukella pontilimi]MXQ06460.1 3-deoxy-manno-octulosonate cytidylyltransferase [Kangsaoukella pontilimi]
MSHVIFIPARYASQRFPGKPLQALTGATGVTKSLIERSWLAARAVSGVDGVYVLTDDERIAEPCRAFGAEVLMTPDTCRNGTERCAAAVPLLDEEPDIVVNLQGDAPLTPPHYVEALVAAMTADPDIVMATPVLRTDRDHLEKLRADRKANRVGGTTAVFAASRDALYFSKEVLPFYDNAPDDAVPVFHHVGCYAYRPSALRQYAALPEGRLERREGLEQLRFLEHGVPVRCVEVEARGRSFWELNNPSDVPLIEDIMKREGIA